MPNSSHWSNSSAPCRIEWWPSPVLAGSLAALGALGAFASLASEAPAGLAALLASASLATGAWLAHRELRRPCRSLVWSSGRGLEVDGERVEDPRLAWRGPLAFLDWRDADGRRCRVSWWPDTLDAAGRRELRLAAMDASPPPGAPSMAP